MGPPKGESDRIEVDIKHLRRRVEVACGRCFSLAAYLLNLVDHRRNTGYTWKMPGSNHPRPCGILRLAVPREDSTWNL